ncbi:unnamed protein product [Rotaria magnacalcarata]|nr:unnamed protein product [Rotaria magnacalcarata]
MYPLITKFFKKPVVSNCNNHQQEANEQVSLTSISTTPIVTPSAPSTSLTSTTSTTSTTSATSTTSILTSQRHQHPYETSIQLTNDIGLHIGKKLTDEQKYELIANHFQPDKKFVWPYKQRVTVLMDKRAHNEIKENRARLRPIIETIIFCGKQNIALRGHRDDGHKIEENGVFSANDGNFRALLQYRIQSSDEELRQHLEKCNKNASYISKTIQNQIISIIGKLILKQIIEEVKQAHFYTVLLDKTSEPNSEKSIFFCDACFHVLLLILADISNVEQASLCTRYILNEQIHEKFLMFIPVSDRSGAGLANLIINTVLVLGKD